jgi:ABC-type multidrug transport system fused ATPase/permease subunit
MDKGFVKEVGTHNELIAEKGIYHQLCKLQELN